MARKLKSGIVGQAQVIFGGAIGMNLGWVKSARGEELAIGMAELKHPSAKAGDPIIDEETYNGTQVTLVFPDFGALNNFRYILDLLEAELKKRIAERDAQQKIDFDDAAPSHLVHEHIDPPTFEEAKCEQKIAEWSKEDEDNVNDLIAYFIADMSLKHTEEDIVNWIKTLKGKIQPQSKREWSKEDEETFSYLEDVVDFCYRNQYVVDVQTCERVRQLLCRLKLRRFQSKWSKDDITRIDEIIETLNIVQANRVRTQRMHYNKATIDKNIDWLKSLKDRYTWKPSDLLIEALESATANCAYSEYEDCLTDLIKQLKKKRKE